jgi:gluconate 5-dehydrogenase
MFELKGKLALITGATNWLGRDMAEVLAQNGASVIVTSRVKEKAEKAAREIAEKYGVVAYGEELEVTSIESIEALAKKCEKLGGVDILINNAGGGSGASAGNLFERDYSAISNMINANLTGVIFVCKAFCAQMAKKGAGKVINIGSIAGIVGRDRKLYHDSNKMEQPVDYAAAKGGVIALTRDLAGFMCDYGVQVNCISPGGFDKGDLPKAFVDGYSDKTMLKRMGKMGVDLKGAALFLASSASDYITGHNLVVDGGFTVWK